MSLLKNNNVGKHFYILCFSLLLTVISLILVNNLKDAPLLPNLTIIALIYIAAYIDVFIGVIFSYTIFYIYGSLTLLNPAIIAFAGAMSYGTAYFLWKKIAADNPFNEILITFFSSMVYYLLLFLSIFYGLGFHFQYWNFFLFYSLPISIITAIVSPVIFVIFKKLGYKHILKKSRIILN